MSAIHYLASVTPLAELDIFGVPPVQTTVKKYIMTEYQPLAILNSSSIIEFEIHCSKDEYLQMREIELYLKIRASVKQKDNSAV